ncbi:type I-G CRISPR-associated protein, Cas3-extension family [Roseospira goensis]|uniref:Uncharacterized protein n=1 Tax=Roseospira goensis TaxID=391922 RepID=A0A7W6S3M3_9PROT|nr:hypothetical protein [Roseospira goensis]MBB4287577.1 hypothetical protein [Roseospira goensis]
MTDQTKTLELELSGLKGDHPLGFLAACGVLRVMGPNSGVRLGWAETHGTWTAVLHDRAATDATGAFRERIVDAVAQAATDVENLLKRFPGIGRTLSIEDYRKKGHWALTAADEDATLGVAITELLPSLGSDSLARDSKGAGPVHPSKMIMTSARQSLETTLKSFILPHINKSRNNRKAERAVEKIENAIFGPWLYEDDAHSLGWDPTTQRLHALRNKAPADDKQKRSVAAAVFLASQALPLFPCFAVGGWLHTTGFHHDNDGDWFSWPIWRAPISLDTLRTLVAQPFTRDLKERGVAVVYRCHRSRTGGDQGDYRVFGHPTKRPWPEM